MSIDILKKEIKNEVVRNLYMFFGPEDYLKKYYLKSIETLIFSENINMIDMNKDIFEGKVKIERLIETCEQVPFMFKKRVVILKNTGMFKASKNKADEAFRNKLFDYFSKMPRYLCLIIIEEEIDSRLKIVKYIKDNGLVVEFKYQLEKSLISWIIKKFNKEKKRIDLSAAERLLLYCGPSMNDIANEIDKLCVYCYDKEEINEEDIQDICIQSVKSKIFDLTDSLFGGDFRKTMLILNDMLAIKEPVPLLFHMVNRQLRLIFQYKILAEEGCSTNEMLSKMGIQNFVLNKIKNQAKNVSTEKIKKLLNTSIELELAIKTGKIKETSALEMLLLSS